MRIAILIEGRTETAFKPFLINFLKGHLTGKMPKLDFVPQHGGLPTNDKLKRVVENLLSNKKHPADAVIALTDVYTGHNPPLFEDGADAKKKLKEWAGNNQNFYAHVALHDFEAWLIPFWEKIKTMAKSNAKRPASNPETVNHGNPPAHRLKAVFESGKRKRSYSKTVDVGRVLKGEDLMTVVNECKEFKSFVNRIIKLSGGEEIA